MTGPGAIVRLGAALAIFAVASPGLCVDKPQYLQRLRLPTLDDDLRHSRSVVADLHTDEVFVCDLHRHRIAIFDRRGVFLYQIPGGNRFRAPRDLAVDPDGFILLAATRDGVPGLIWLDFDGLFVRDLPLSGALLDGTEPVVPVSVALSGDGQTAYVLDQANRKLWIADREGRVRRGVALDENLEEEDALEQIFGHVDVYGDTVLVAIPTEGQVFLFDLDGTRRKWVGTKGTATCQTAFPTAGALDREGNVVVVDSQKALGTIWKRDGNRCLLEFSGIGRSPGALYQPADVALDSRGRIYVSQGFEGRVQVFGKIAPAAGSPEQSAEEQP